MKLRIQRSRKSMIRNRVFKDTSGKPPDFRIRWTRCESVLKIIEIFLKYSRPSSPGASLKNILFWARKYLKNEGARFQSESGPTFKKKKGTSEGKYLKFFIFKNETKIFKNEMTLIKWDTSEGKDDDIVVWMLKEKKKSDLFWPSFLSWPQSTIEKGCDA